MVHTDYELVVFDGDETLVDGDIIHALGAHAGVGDEIKRIQERVWQDDLEPMEALSEHIFPLFEGLTLEEVEDVVQSLPFAPGATDVGRHVTCQTAIFTALTPLARHVAAELDMEYYRANEPVIDDGALTGELGGDIVERGKGPVLDDLVASLGIDHDQVIAVGDGPQDRPLFTRAGFSIGIDPKPAVRDVPDVVVSERNLYSAAPYLAENGVLDLGELNE